MSFCPQCGRASFTGASFCAGCGANLAPGAPPSAPVAAPAPPAPPTPPVRPTGVTVIGVGVVLLGAFTALGALFMLGAFAIGGAIVAAVFGSSAEAIGALVGVFVLVIALFMGAFAALFIASGVGFLRGRSWARLVVLVLAGLWALGGVLALADQDPSGILAAAAGGVTLWYLFQPGAKAWFGESRHGLSR